MTPHQSTDRAELTDRYVATVLRSVPAHKRADIERELRSSIADAIDARAAGGAEPAVAEAAVLTDLGDPARLAAGYTGEPLHLIGPALFLDYLRLLRTLAATVLPITAVTLAVVHVTLGESIGPVIGTTIATTLTVAVHLGFWTTLLFAVLERVSAVRAPLTGPWNLSMLPDAGPAPSRPGARRTTEVVTIAAGSALFVTAILLAPALSPRQDAAGQPINILHPWLWDHGLVYAYIGLLLLGVAATVASHYSSRARVAAALGGIPSAVLLLWLAANDHVLNPAFAAAVDWPDGVTNWVRTGLIIVAALGIAMPIIEFVKIIRRSE